MAEEQTFEEEIMTLGDGRKHLYAYLESEGFEMTEKRHKNIKRFFNKAVAAETQRFEGLADQLHTKMNYSTTQVMTELKKINPKSFSEKFKPKYRDQLRNLINKVQQYMLTKEEIE